MTTLTTLRATTIEHLKAIINAESVHKERLQAQIHTVGSRINPDVFEIRKLSYELHISDNKLAQLHDRLHVEIGSSTSYKGSTHHEQFDEFAVSDGKDGIGAL
jgi:hypothetical protein